MEHLYFTLFNFAVFGIVLWLDRRRARDYALLSAVGLAAAFIFENATTVLGFWQYHSGPYVPYVSVFTWLLYVPYLGFCYFIGGRLGGPK